MHKYSRLLVALAIVLLVTACGTGTVTIDPYADPDVEPPPAITDPTIATSGSLVVSDASDDLLDLNVAGFADALDEAVTDLPEGAFTVVEDGVVQGITVERISADARAAADVVFVFDTTGSMGGALTSVQNSITAFADFLNTAGLDVRLGAVTFGDAFDTTTDPATRGTSITTPDNEPGFDGDERPSFPLSTDVAAFKTFIDGDSARGGGDGLENALGAVNFAYENLAWREGAQRIMIVITDICAHSATSFETFNTDPDYAAYAPPELAALNSKLGGSATVHVVAPGADCYTTDGVHTKELAGVSGTGGVFSDWDGLSEFDLTTLPISETAAGGYVITFRGDIDGTEHTVRVVIDDGGSIRGEFTLVDTY